MGIVHKFVGIFDNFNLMWIVIFIIYMFFISALNYLARDLVHESVVSGIFILVPSGSYYVLCDNVNGKILIKWSVYIDLKNTGRLL
jgi:hypothetical protein